MLDIDTFLTILYCRVDEFCKTHPERSRPGEAPALSRSEVVTLSIFGQWGRFQSERDFYRFAQQRLRGLFPTLPDRTQFNRQARLHHDLLVAFFLHLAKGLQTFSEVYEAIDSSAVVTRDSHRRGFGWLPGEADIGDSSRLGWFEGFRLLLSVTPSGVITGWGLGAASAKDQPLAEVFFLLRCEPQPGFESVGAMASSYLYLPEWGEEEFPTPHLGDRGFEGEARRKRWKALYGATVMAPPKRNSKQPWPKSVRRWLASLRQIVETVFDKVQNTFRLCRERPHQRLGLMTRLAAKLALHNFCIHLNDQIGRPRLAFADLLGWL
jgi:hypothetical protein